MNDKLSKYNIEVEYSDGVIIYNGLTDKMLSISFEDYAIIETLMENLSEFKNIFPKIYFSFRDAGFIVNNTFDELAFIKLQNKKKVYSQRKYHVTINPTLGCNLKCWYCSVGYAGAQHNNEAMDETIIESLTKHIEYLINNNADSVMLDWFGGEPLLFYDEVMKKISKRIIPLITDKNITFTQQITTNGTLLNKERIIEMRDGNFIFFQITLDGDKAHHNKIKYYSNNEGTYTEVVSNINLILEHIPNAVICLRINYDKQSLKRITDIMQDISEVNRDSIMVDFQKVWQVKFGDREKELLLKAKEAFKNAGFKVSYGVHKPLRFTNCYADSIYHYVINYNGKVFKCTARDYGDNICLGQLDTSGLIIWDENILGKYFEKATFENEMCEKCKMLPFCMGPCIQHNFESRMNNTPLKCILENYEYSVQEWIIDKAKNHGII